MSIELPAVLTSIVNQAVVPKAAQIKQHGIKQHGVDLSGAAVCDGPVYGICLTRSSAWSMLRLSSLQKSR